MADKQHVLLVNGYGCHTQFEDPKIDRFLKGYRRYLNKVARFVDEYLPDFLLFSGAETQQNSAPGQSEAKVMWEFVFPRLNMISREKYLHLKQVRLEDRSFTTFYNSYYAYGAIFTAIGTGVLKNEPCLITHFCEAHRAPNVNQCDRACLTTLVEDIDDLRLETESWERADPFKQAGNLIYNKLAIKYPWLGLAERERRKRIHRAKYI
ncbi:MAG: hypothetical protein AAB857_02400 [Patescibacteria group bacterium]